MQQICPKQLQYQALYLRGGLIRTTLSGVILGYKQVHYIKYHGIKK